MGNPNRRARRNAKKSERKCLIDEPKTSEQGDETEKTEEGLSVVGTAPLSSAPASTSQSAANDPKNKTQRGNHIMRALVAVGRWVKNTFGFLDEHNGSITALATVAIVLLTSFYVEYSKRQWEAMQGQLEEMRKDQRAWLFVTVEEPEATSALAISDGGMMV